MREPIILPVGPDRVDPSPQATMRPCSVGICGILEGSTLFALRVRAKAEWAELPERERPGRHAYFPGLGWVGTDPIADKS